ncbi:hypothetical protein ACOYR1_08975 [Thalassotalea piscium]
MLIAHKMLINFFKLALAILIFQPHLVLAEDKINAFSVQETLTVGEIPVIKIDVDVTKKRDLHVILKNGKTQRNINTIKKPIKRTGKYHFNFDIDELPPGNYRWNAFITPRKKNGNDRIGDTATQMMRVITVEQAAINQQKLKELPKNNKVNKATEKHKKVASKDGFKKINWPKNISNNDAYILTVDYLVTKARDIHIKLLNSENWEEHGKVKISVNENGTFSLPFDSLLENFGPGKYAWVLSITEVGEPDNIVKKMGRHFVISKPEK